MTDRDSIPSATRRRLRQEAGFGCCVCGHPFVEYHHIVPYAEEAKHDVKNLMALCPIHHHQCTVGALSVDAQRNAKANPYNVVRGYAEGQLVWQTSLLAVECGQNFFVGSGFKFVVDGEPLLRLRRDASGQILISINLYDENDQLILFVEENEWISGDSELWDLKFAYNRLTLQRQRGSTSLSIDARRSPIRLSGSLWRRGQHFQLRTDQVRFDGVLKHVGYSDLGLVGYMLDANTSAKTLHLRPQPPLKHGAFVSWPDRAERLKHSINAYDALLRTCNIDADAPCPCESGATYGACHGAI